MELVQLDEHGKDKYGISRGPIPIINAAGRGLSKIVRKLVEQGNDVSLTNDAGFTALHAAAHHGHADIARVLAKAGSDLEATTLEGDTPLHLATSVGETAAMRALIEEGASVNSRNPGGATPLYIAAMEGHLGAVKVLLHAKANPLLTWSSESSGRRFVPLEVAAQTGRSGVVSELLREFGIRCCGGPSGGFDALRVAAVYGQVDIMSMLMDAGVVDPVGLALLAAVGSGKEVAVGFLLRQQEEQWQTSYVNIARDDDGLTALLWSFRGNNDKPCNPRITRRLVDAGADTTSAVQLRTERSRTRVNVTPLEYVNDWALRETNGDHPATDEQLLLLEATRRVLLRAVAVHADSWMWPSDDPVLERPANSPRTAKHSPTPLTTMLPVLRRRARRRPLLWDTLFRYPKES
ncbi:unnamed protein product [Ectocarpus sp. 12 AP-2014]